MGAHAKLSPSAASIWMACPGQPHFAARFERRSSDHADRGTMAHHFLECALQEGISAATYLGEHYEIDDRVFTMKEEDCDAVQMALDFIRGEIEDGDEWETETRLRYNDDLWGTCDFSRYRPANAELLVVDYKHGSGVAVEAFENPQGVIYALMKAKSLGNRGIGSIRFVIVQPRCFHEDGPIREFVIDGVDMLDWEDKVAAAIEQVSHAEWAAENNPNTFAAMFLTRGKHCKWCPANFAGGCPKVQADIDAAAVLDFSAPDRGYDPAKLAEALAVCDRAEAAIKATRAFAYQEAAHGVTLPGWKIVAKRPTERWVDADGAVFAAEMMGVPQTDLVKEPEIKTPAQVRSLIAEYMEGKTKKNREDAAKAWLADFTERVSSGTKLVPESEPGVPVSPENINDFEPITE